VAGAVAILEHAHEALANAVELHACFNTGEPVERILARQEYVSDDIAKVFCKELIDVRISIRERTGATGDRDVDGLLRKARRILKPVAQIGVPDKGARIAKPAVNVAGDGQLMVAEE